MKSAGRKTPQSVPWGRVAFGLTIAVVSCGCGDGVVPAEGHIRVEGRPASGGQLILIPTGEGPRAVAMVSEEGAFALRMGDQLGVQPGAFHLSYRHPMDSRTQEQLSNLLAGRLTSSEITVSYKSPRDRPLVVPDSGATDLVIDIRAQEGWTRDLSD